MNIKYNDYVIDFERVNKLTSHPNDNPNSGSAFSATFIYGLTRKILKEYLEIYSSYNKLGGKISMKVTDEEYHRACEVLHFNKILVSMSDIRDKRIDNVLDSDPGPNCNEEGLPW